MLVAVLVAATSMLFLITERRHLVRESESGQAGLIKGLVRVSRESRMREDDLFLLNYIKTLKKSNPSVDYAVFTDMENRIIAHSDTEMLRKKAGEGNREKEVTPSTMLVREKDMGGRRIREYAVPVFLGDTRAGTAMLGFDMQKVNAGIDGVMKETGKRIIAVSGITLALGIAGALMLSAMMLGPIRKLSEGAEKIGSGKLDTKIEIVSKDELGYLAGEFNIMAQKLKELDRMKRDFVSSVTHELRSPLTAIESYVSDMIDGGMEQFEKTGPDDLAVIKNNAIRLSRFITDLLDTAKIESGKLSMNIQPGDIRSPVGDAVKLFAAKARRKNITLSAEIPGGLPGVYADEERVRQVVINLVGNGLKFTPENGSIRISAAVMDEDRDFMLVTVTDSGTGIPASKLNGIFDKFEQVRGSREKATGAKGTGLGLYIVKNIVEMHKGKVWAESPADGGKGSRFCFTLPVVNFFTYSERKNNDA